MIKILFICHGNICRSPMAEFVMKDMLQREGLGDAVEVASAATSTEELGNNIYPPVRRELAKHGVAFTERHARQMNRRDYAYYDMLIGMDKNNKRNMLRICGADPEEKMSLLMDYTEKPHDVADPWYTGDFNATWNDVEEGCKGLLEYLRQKGI